MTDVRGPEVGTLVPVDEIDLSTLPTAPQWIPCWLVDGGDFEMGIAVDDHCFLVLAKNRYGEWRPSPWVPWQAARRLGELEAEVTP